MPILSKAAVAAAAAAANAESENNEELKREDGDELRISESGQSPSVID